MLLIFVQDCRVGSIHNNGSSGVKYTFELIEVDNKIIIKQMGKKERKIIKNDDHVVIVIVKYILCYILLITTEKYQ